MIYKTVDFEAYPFSYHLELEDRITLVRGDSATGKTYLYELLEDLKLTDDYSAIKLFNYKSDDFHMELKSCRNKFIVIDNADIILNDEDRKFINFEKSNQYMLFMRNCDGLNLSAKSFTVLDEKEYHVTLKRELVMGFKYYSTERVMKSLTNELTDVDEWSVKGDFMGKCWYKDCCVLERPEKAHCHLEAFSGEKKIMTLLQDDEMQRIIQNI